jgi:Zn-dependent peptidase ImmA (M78 family)
LITDIARCLGHPPAPIPETPKHREQTQQRTPSTPDTSSSRSKILARRQRDLGLLRQENERLREQYRAMMVKVKQQREELERVRESLDESERQRLIRSPEYWVGWDA